MKIAAIASALLATAALALAQTAAPATPAPAPARTPTEKMIDAALPLCADTTVTRKPAPMKLPTGFTGTLIEQSSKSSHTCEGQYVSVVSPTGSLFLGVPWSLADVEGKTIEEKLKAFSWAAMQQNVEAVVDRSQRTRDGLYRVTLYQITGNGRLPLEGEVDADGRVFFLGHFVPQGTDLRAARLKVFEPIIANAPARGAAKPAVTVIEFSDFQCPSCKRAAHYLDPILARHGDAVRYVRYDLPLVGYHPWALPAAIAGRAIWRQKPEGFWTFKQRVYENQDKLNAFTIDDFARGIAQDLELDMARYEGDVASAAVRDEVLKGVGLAYSNDVRATPTYIVNGNVVDPGNEGEDLAKYVESLLAK